MIEEFIERSFSKSSSLIFWRHDPSMVASSLKIRILNYDRGSMKWYGQ
jgi:hypothetical protein